MFIATIPTVIYVDKLGRKPIMIVGGIGMLFCHFTIAIIFAKNEHSWAEHKAAGWAAVAMVWLFVINFGYSWGRECTCPQIFCPFQVEKLTYFSLCVGPHQRNLAFEQSSLRNRDRGEC